MSDQELLRQFVQDRSQPAFAEFVRRHVDWVHSAALRRVRDPHLAEDVTQATFLVLAQKAAALQKHTVLTAWLFTVMTHVSAQVREREATRRHHETQAAQAIQRMLQTRSSETVRKEWDEIAEVLDEVVARLRRSDREVVLLRFYQQKSFAEVGALIGISEEAARKRVSRAIEELRGMLAGKGVGMQGAALSGILLAEASKPAPATLGAAILKSSAATTNVSVGALMKGAIRIMVWTKLKLGAVAAAALLLVGGATVAVIYRTHDEKSAAPVQAASTSAAATTWRDRFDQVYHLEPGQVAKHVIDPPAYERHQYWEELRADSAAKGGRMIPEPPTIIFEWNGSLKTGAVTSSSYTLEYLLHRTANFETYDFEAADDLRSFQMTGDWIIDVNMPIANRLEAISQTLNAELKRTIRFEQRPTDQAVVVLQGKYLFHQTAVNHPDNHLHLYAGTYDPKNRILNDGTWQEFLKNMGNTVRMRFVDETPPDGHPEKLEWTWHRTASEIFAMPPGEARSQKFNELLDALSSQTGLTCTIAHRTFDLWHAQEARQ